MTPPRVSVCIRSVDRPESLRRAIASVLAQQFADLELIVSFDGSDPGELQNEFPDPRLRVVRNPGASGATANLAHAFGLAAGEFLAVLDDDDEWTPGFLSALMPVFDQDDRLGVVFSDYELLAGEVTIERPWPWPTGPQADMLVPLLDRSIPPSAAVIRRETYLDGERLLPLSPNLAGAATIWLRAAAQGWKFHHVQGALVRYRLHSEQMSWSAITTASRFATTLEALTFTNTEAERMRHARLAEAYFTQAGIHLRRGKLIRARGDLRRARAHGPLLRSRNLIALTGVRRVAARLLPSHPRLLASALPIWQRVRPRPS